MSKLPETEVFKMKWSNRTSESSGSEAQGHYHRESIESDNTELFETLKSFVNTRQAVETAERAKSMFAIRRSPTRFSRIALPMLNTLNSNTNSPKDDEMDYTYAEQIKDLQRDLALLYQEYDDAQNFSKRKEAVWEREKQDLCRQLELEEDMSMFLKKELAASKENLREVMISNQELRAQLQSINIGAEYETAWSGSGPSRESLAEEEWKIAQHATIKRMESKIENLKDETQRTLSRELDLEDLVKALKVELKTKDTELSQKSLDVRQANKRLEDAFDAISFLEEEKKASKTMMLQLESEVFRQNSKINELTNQLDCLQWKQREENMKMLDGSAEIPLSPQAGQASYERSSTRQFAPLWDEIEENDWAFNQATASPPAYGIISPFVYMDSQTLSKFTSADERSSRTSRLFPTKMFSQRTLIRATTLANDKTEWKSRNSTKKAAFKTSSWKSERTLGPGPVILPAKVPDQDFFHKRRTSGVSTRSSQRESFPTYPILEEEDSCSVDTPRISEIISRPSAQKSIIAFQDLEAVASSLEQKHQSRPSFEVRFSQKPLSVSTNISTPTNPDNSAMNLLWSYRTLAWSSSFLFIIAAVYYFGSIKRQSEVTVSVSKAPNPKYPSETGNVKLIVTKSEMSSSGVGATYLQR